MASIRQRGPRTWQVQSYVGRDETGAKRYATRTVHGTKADATKAATALQAEVDAGKIRVGDDLTFAELITRWVAARSPSWSPGYRAEAVRILTNHAVPTIGEVRIDRLRPADLDALYARLRSEGLGQSSIATLHRRIKAALGQAVRWDIIATNPAARLASPKEPRSRAQAATAAQVATVLALAAEEPDLAAFIRITAVTGARRGEVCALRWDHVDLDRAEVTFAQAISMGTVVKATKEERAKRLAIDEGTVQVLAALRSAQRAIDLADGTRSPWLFPAPMDRSRPIRPERMSKRWAALRDRAGHPGLRLHDLRHGVGTGGMEAGYTPMEVAARLGHARPSTTTDLYGHHAPARDRRLADELGARLDEAIDRAG